MLCLPVKPGGQRAPSLGAASQSIRLLPLGALGSQRQNLGDTSHKIRQWSVQQLLLQKGTWSSLNQITIFLSHTRTFQLQQVKLDLDSVSIHGTALISSSFPELLQHPAPCLHPASQRKTRGTRVHNQVCRDPKKQEGQIQVVEAFQTPECCA